MSHSRPPFKAENEISQERQPLAYYRLNATQRRNAMAIINEMLIDLDDTHLVDVLRLVKKHHAEHCPHCY